MASPLHVRMSDDDYAVLQQASGGNLSDWTRTVLIWEARRLLEQPSHPEKTQVPRAE